MPPFSDAIIDLEQMGNEIAEMSAHIDAATHALLTKIRRFDELEGWGVDGAATCVQWLSWRLALTPATAREKLRVAHALATLPEIDAAFQSGQLSYSKVRAMTRVGTPGNESTLLQMARYATGAQLEKICRAFRRAVTPEKGTADPGDAARTFRHYPTESGMVRFEIEAYPDEAELILKGIQAARCTWKERRDVSAETSDGPDPDTSPENRTDVSAETPARPSSVDALILLAESFLARGPAARRGGERNQLFIHLAREDVGDAGWETSAGFTPRLHDSTQLSEETLLRLACDSGIVPVLTGSEGEPLDVGRRTRSIPPAIYRALHLRDRGCRFPGCSHEAFLEGHHIRHWGHGGKTKLSNLMLLCHFHHHLLHEGGFRVENHGGKFTFARPDGRVLDTVPVRIHGNGIDRIKEANRRTGTRIDAESLRALGGGEPFDCGLAVAGLFDDD